MTKKEIILPITVLGLTLLFAGICVAVFLTNGKSAKWVSRKMKIGGLLLSLTAIVQTGCHRNTLCYKFADPIPSITDAEFKLTSTKKDHIAGKLKNTQSIYHLKKEYERWKSEGYDSTNINGWLRPLISKMKETGPSDLICEILNYKTNEVIRDGSLIPTDSKFDGDKKESFKVEFENKLPRGKYLVKVYYKNLYFRESLDYPDPFKIEIGTKIIKIRK